MSSFEPALLLSGELQAVLELHLLPSLSARELGRLSCMCRVVQAWLDQVDARLWRAAAAKVLPAKHPPLGLVGTAGTRQALQRSCDALRNISKGKVTDFRQFRACFAAISPQQDSFAAYCERGPSTSGREICIYSIATGKLLHTWRAPGFLHAERCLAFTEDVQRLVVVSNTHEEIGDTNSGGWQWHITELATGSITTTTLNRSLEWTPNLSPNGRFLACTVSGQAGRQPQLWRVSVGQFVTALTTESYPRFSFSDNSTTIWSGGRGSRAWLVNLLSGEQTVMQGVKPYAISPDGYSLMVQGLAPLTVHEQQGYHLIDSGSDIGVFSADSSKLAAWVDFGDGPILFICARTAAVLSILPRFWEHADDFVMAGFSPDNTYFAMYGQVKEVVLFDVTCESAVKLVSITTDQWQAHSWVMSTENLRWTHEALVITTSGLRGEVSIVSFAPTV